MSTNMTLITSVTVGSGGAASVTLPATGTIPQTYTDLMLVMSVRTDRANIADGYLIKPNNTNPTVRYITGDGSTAYSGTNYSGIFPAANATASTFGNAVAYFPNYANTSNNKSFSVDDVSENNATGAYATLSANLYSSTSAITTIVVQSINSANIVQGSTFYLYGISNVTSTTKATGGIVSSDGTYNYHMFPYSGTFTPTQNITADYLVIAGGGAGGSQGSGGGGGAGGLRSTVGTTGGGGSLESPLSLTANTAYTVTVGAGGAQTTAIPVNSGSNSVFSTITATGGGGGGGYSTIQANADGDTGGSGGGGAHKFTGTPADGVGGAGTANQGYAGGNGKNSAGYGGGGGGAGAAGAAAVTGTNAGAGGNGVAISAFANATQTGVNGYYAGGGGGGAYIAGSQVSGNGGLGGGGRGADGTRVATAGGINTGSGGGGDGYPGSVNAAGGSGLVIIRYAI